MMDKPEGHIAVCTDGSVDPRAESVSIDFVILQLENRLAIEIKETLVSLKARGGTSVHLDSQPYWHPRKFYSRLSC